MKSEEDASMVKSKDDTSTLHLTPEEAILARQMAEDNKLMSLQQWQNPAFRAEYERIRPLTEEARLNALNAVSYTHLTLPTKRIV